MKSSVKLLPRLLVTLLAAVLLLSTVACASQNASAFNDVPDSAWYKSTVDEVVSSGLMSGVSKTSFAPEESITRGMFVRVLWNYAGSPEEGENHFTDVPDASYYTKPIAWAAHHQIVSGMSATIFEPETEITREQLALILYHYAKKCGLDTSKRGSFDGFADQKQVSAWAKEAMQWAIAEQLVYGESRTGALYLNPQGNATRAEAAAIIMRYIKNVMNETNDMDKLAPSELFSFQYDGKDSSEFLSTWEKKSVTETMENGTVETVTWTDPEQTLSVTLEIKKYSDSGAMEWVARLKNIGSENTKLVEDFHIADLLLQTGEDTTISYSKGTDIREDDFLFVEQPLALYSKRTFYPNGGRSSSGDCMPYFNLSSSLGGCFLAVGWTGQWEASFQHSAEGVHVVAGMEETHFVLYPDESVRTPSFVVLQWEDMAQEDSYQLWRAFMLQNHTPKDESGEVVTLPLTNGAWGGDAVQNHLNTIGFISNSDYDFDAYWIDAGWFGEESRHSSDQYGDEWFKNAGDWYHNETLYPDGLSTVSDAAHENGMDFLLWFEPERAWCDSELVREHPEWFLNTGTTENTSYLFNMGDPEARQWMTDFISQKIEEYGVDIYRQDFNIDPLPFWQAADSADRKGITEMKYIEGLYAYLDGLLEQNPGLILDNCAGGGRRLDYEILTRALPLFRSDYQCFTDYKTTPCQVQTDGLSYWVPLSGTCTQYRPNDTYSFRSNLAYAMQTPASDQSAWQKAMIAQFHQAQPYFTGNYYRVSRGDVTSEEAWYAYQMHRQDLNEGFILAFRRENAENTEETLSIYVPQSAKELTLTDADTGESWTVSVAEAANSRFDLTLRIENRTESKLLFYTFN